jgi:lysophospholipase L1-like esterase
LSQAADLDMRKAIIMRSAILYLVLAIGVIPLGAQNLQRAAGPSSRPDRSAPPKFQFKKGDRVVFLGDPWLGGEQKDAYVETMLTSRLDGQKVVFRNLAWAPESQRGVEKKSMELFDKEIKRLKGPLEVIKPTVVILGYGTEESRDGEAGLERFKRDINNLMNSITNLSGPDEVRFLIVTPLCEETPAVAEAEARARNAQLELYANALRQMSTERKARLVDVFEAMRLEHTRPGLPNWTKDGIHLSPYGYWQIGGVFEWSLTLFPGVARMGIGVNNSVRRGSAGVVPENITRAANSIRFTGRDEFVFRPLVPLTAGVTNNRDGFPLQIYPMPDGKFTLKIDGEVSAVHTGKEWASAATIRHGPLYDRVEALRHAIIRKNELCSSKADRAHVFGFLKHKPAGSAGLGPVSDPAVAVQEEKIFQLLELKTRQYEVGPAEASDGEALKTHDAGMTREGKT